MTPFKPDGFYNGIPYRVLFDSSIEAMTRGGLVKFENIDQLVALSPNDAVDSETIHSVTQYNAFNSANEPAAVVSASTKPDYYSSLLQLIKTTKQNSAQLRALVYERARFNLKREVLFGDTSSLPDLMKEMNDLELAVTRIEANAIDDPPVPVDRERVEILEPPIVKSSNAIQILPPLPVAPLYAGLKPIQWMDHFQLARVAEEFVRHARLANKFRGFALFGIAFIGAAVLTAFLWPVPKITTQSALENSAALENAVNHSHVDDDRTVPSDGSSKIPFPLPVSFGVYVLSNSKLVELEALPINIPDPRIALSAEIRQPSATIISDSRPAFILFRRDLLNNSPQKIMLRVVARMTKQTKIIGGKASTTVVDGAWRVRDISRDLKISPVDGQREMVIARLDDNVSLTPGRYALVLNRSGYDFTVDGAAQSPVFCLEGFETATGSVFTQCRAP